MLNATKLSNTLAGSTNKNVLDVANSSNRWMTIDSDGNEVTDPDVLTKLNSGKTVAPVADLENGDFLCALLGCRRCFILAIEQPYFGIYISSEVDKTMGESVN